MQKLSSVRNICTHVYDKLVLNKEMVKTRHNNVFMVISLSVSKYFIYRRFSILIFIENVYTHLLNFQ